LERDVEAKVDVKKGGKVWTGFVWLEITSGRLL
jgi:hypothetical protein